MKLGYSELRDRIAGCWQGKNAGGALGAPLECKRGKVDVIVVKPISRFARNTIDCIKITRMLRELNVDVYFEE